MHSSPPMWLEVLGWISIVLAVAIAGYILVDIYVVGRRQKMGIMEAVYPITALYWGPVALWFYRMYGLRNVKQGTLVPEYVGRAVREEGGEQAQPSQHGQQHAGDGQQQEESDIKWWQIWNADTHCGAGCTLGDIGGEWIVFAFGLTIASRALYVDYIFDFVFAWTLGVVFQYFTIVPMRQLSPLRGIWAAMRADTLSIVAFQIGLFAGMAAYQLGIFDPELSKSTASYWFLMQLSMILGFFTAYPVNRWLIAVGWKERM